MIFTVLNPLITNDTVCCDITAVDEYGVIPEYRWNMVSMPLDPMPSRVSIINLIKSVVAGVYSDTEPGPILDQMAWQYSRPDLDHTLVIDRPDAYPNLGI